LKLNNLLFLWRWGRVARHSLCIMPRTSRRIIAGIVWVIGSLIAWAVVCNIFAFVVFIYLNNERHVKLPAGIDTVYNWTSIAGGVLIPPIVAVLPIRSYLPGTGERASKLRGFPVEHSRPPDRE
jgi:hypothetical protein